MKAEGGNHRRDLQEIARRVMIERGFLPDFSAAALEELSQIDRPALASRNGVRDLRDLLWCSIDNDDSLDLDQLSVAEDRGSEAIRIRVAVADVDAVVHKGSEIDGHARHNTTSVYTPAKVFPMLPEKLSTDLTSLADGQDRLAVVVEFDASPQGALLASDVYRAAVRNRAKLAYRGVGGWLEESGELPEEARRVPGMDRQLRVQDALAQKLRERRQQKGALDLETIEARAIFDQDRIVDLRVDPKNRARELIEEFMIAANGVTARYLASRRLPAIRRIVRVPERWGRIREVASEFGETLPLEPDARALETFLAARRSADPLRFPDLSLVIVKLIGRGEYVLEPPGGESIGHFGLAVRDYTHSTAPNRRFPDVITQRLLKAALDGSGPPYAEGELEDLARHLTQKENDAEKVERRVRKSAAALLLSHRIGEVFDGIVTGASESGTWVRVLAPPVEGKLVRGSQGLDVGARVRVQLLRTDVERGFIDFARK
jgi:VacB/RNase II family 3'-5' exoribonuclease